MLRRTFIGAASAAATMLALSGAAWAQETVKIGLILPMTGPFASTGRQIEAARQALHAAEGRHGRRQEDPAHRQGRRRRRRRDEAARPGADRQRKGRACSPGFGLTPLALATAPLATQAKVPAVVMAAAHGDHHRGLALHRAHELHPAAGHRADGRLGGQERHQEGRDPGLRLRPGHRRRESLLGAFTKAGGQVENLRVPLANPDFSPFLQKVADAKPDALFVFVPVGRRRAVHEAVRGARPRQERHQADRRRRRHGRRPAQRHGRRGARRDHDAPLLGGARQPGEQGLRGGVQEGQQRHAAELHGGGRL